MPSFPLPKVTRSSGKCRETNDAWGRSGPHERAGITVQASEEREIHKIFLARIASTPLEAGHRPAHDLRAPRARVEEIDAPRAQIRRPRLVRAHADGPAAFPATKVAEPREIIAHAPVVGPHAKHHGHDLVDR